MSLLSVSRRYAEALADVAISDSQVDVIGKELAQLAELFGPGSELRALFASPIISQADKKVILKTIVERAGPSNITANLLGLLLKHYRLQYLASVEEQFQREINKRRNILKPEITTAAPIAAAESERLSRELQELTGKTIQAEFKTDPALIGGAVTRMGSMVYDGSIRTQLHTIKNKLKKGDY